MPLKDCDMFKLRLFSAALLLMVPCTTEITISTLKAQQEIPQKSDKIPEGRSVYMGREIAQTMHYTGAPWLIRENRENEERCSLMLANLKIKTGMTICDMGCGNGFYALQLAKMVGPEGEILAVDVQPQMLYPVSYTHLTLPTTPYV